ncbi:MAG: XrtA system polysaccharide chain length determinant [Pseudomonadota bacterium]
MADYRAFLMEHLAALKRFRWQALGVAWLVCLLGWLFLASMPDRYSSRARLYIHTETVLGPLMKGLVVSPDVNRQVEMMRRTLLSVPNLEELIRMTDLDHTVDNDLERSQLIKDLERDINIENESATLFEISYADQDPRLAQRVVDSVAQIFVGQNLGHSQRDVEEARDFIDRQIEDYEVKLRQAEVDMAKFRKQHASELGNANRGQHELGPREDELRRLHAEIEAAIWRRGQLKLHLGSTPKTVRPALEDSSEAGRMGVQQEIEALAHNLQTKLKVHSDAHPEVIALRGMVENAQRQLEVEQARANAAKVSVPNPQYIVLAEELQLTEATIQGLRQRLSYAENEGALLPANTVSAPEVQAELTRLNRDYNVLLAQYEQLVQRRESAQISRDLDRGLSHIEYRIIDPPSMPLQPIGPPRGLFLAAILMVGFGTGLAFAIGRQCVSGSFLTVDQLKLSVDLPVLGGVSEAIRPVQPRGVMSGWGGVASGSFALVAVFVALLYFSEAVPPETGGGGLATSPYRAPLQWIWAKL